MTAEQNAPGTGGDREGFETRDDLTAEKSAAGTHPSSSRPRRWWIEPTNIMVLLQTILAFAAIIFSLVAYDTATTLTSMQHMRSVFDAWMEVDTFLLEHPDLIATARQLERPDLVERTPEQDQKRLLSFILLNPLYSYRYAVRHGYVDPSMSEKVLGRHPKPAIDGHLKTGQRS